MMPIFIPLLVKRFTYNRSIKIEKKKATEKFLPALKMQRSELLSI